MLKNHSKMASRRPVTRLLSQCRAHIQLGPRRTFSSTPSQTTFAPLRRYLGLTAFGLLVSVPLAYKMAIDEPLKMDSLSLAERDQQAKREQGVTETSPMRLRMEKFIKEQQREIVKALEKVDGTKFRVDEWQRKEGGGGITCCLQDGKVFEKAGVGVSVVYGTLPKPAIMKMSANHKNIIEEDGQIPESLEFFAAGLSLIVHPKNPMAPTVHLNYRYFETAKPDGTSGTWWFGGGSDLTPNYLFDEDAVQFHRDLKEVCDKHNKDYFPKFKKWCDEYFYNKHRGESRGIGGIFFDDLDETVSDKENIFAFIQDSLKSFIPTYTSIVNRRKDMPFTPEEKDWQQVRRGRYVEFNLVHDRGTSFGLNTPGARVESILMSMPLTASWKYMHEPEPGSREARLVEVLQNPKEWV
ncbi:putative coproporphyrinogen III oxidase mitochondrial precursor [Cladorrhinum samala]|uniref:coproporphyrinogen oxidase n=1 Tax=Cladorrhinum samala TaxID=585594 RepID=A0AAV9HJV8_9PEZI|nr:putative coproporphyrinogen III oxidase mitochondrial precursor [Cladorrhinum samala]